MSETRKNGANLCDSLAAYELKLLSNKDSVQFENHLPQCSSCLEELFALAPEISELTSRPDGFARHCKENLPQEPLRTRLSRIFITGPGRVLVPVAMAAILAVLMLMPQSSVHKYCDLAITDAPAFSTFQVRSGQQNPWQPLWESGMNHYQHQEFNPAADDLKQVVSLLSSQTDIRQENAAALDNARLYLGVSRILAGKHLESIGILTEASHSPLVPIQQKSLWYLAQAQLLDEQPEAAIAVLGQLRNSPVFGPRAVKLIADIETLMAE